MPKVLVVDDEPGFRRHLHTALAAAGHDVQTAANGREAIDVGARLRPDLLVVDWLLGGRIHGLHVADALRAVRPELRTLLITGFLTRDLRGDAGQSRVFDCIEKPFDLDRFLAAAGAALAAREAPRPSPLAVVDVAADGRIQYANATARELFASTRAGPDAASFTTLFGVERVPGLTGASARWIEAVPDAPIRTSWKLRARAWPDHAGWLVVLCRGAEHCYGLKTLADLLLGAHEPAPARWPLADHVLLVDSRPVSRTVAAASLRDAGCDCHAADTADEAIRLFERDAHIRVVIVDVDHAAASAPQTSAVSDLLDAFRRSRPGTTIVLIRDGDPPSEFASRHGERFLREPWSVEDLIRAVTGHIGPCIECGVPLPLRQPHEGERPERWVCADCGAHYEAVLREDAPPATRENATRMDAPTG